MQRSQAVLQRKLRADLESEMEAGLAAQRMRVVAEQQHAIEEARRRADELHRARRVRRTLETELARYQRECLWAQQRNESEGEALKAQVSLLDREAAQSAQAMAAEFSDLLQKQALERDLLRAQVEELRLQQQQDEQEKQLETDAGAVATLAGDRGAYGAAEAASVAAAASAVAAAAAASANATADSSAADQRKLEESDAELKRLKAETEEIHEAFVKLKAAIVACGGTLVGAVDVLGVPLSAAGSDAAAAAAAAAGLQAAARQPRNVSRFANLTRSGSIGSASSLSTSGSVPTLQASTVGGRPVTPHHVRSSAGGMSQTLSMSTSMTPPQLRGWGTASPVPSPARVASSPRADGLLFAPSPVGSAPYTPGSVVAYTN